MFVFPGPGIVHSYDGQYEYDVQHRTPFIEALAVLLLEVVSRQPSVDSRFKDQFGYTELPCSR